jgi:diaminohydroxyphosphoribosylaminopyrimidine deaminase/5-amino-6-(5-phosphoribosylamino)uracil reductase
MESAEQSLLERAIALAVRGRGHVEPNPMVGCVLVRDGQVIGEGFHAKVGGAHAEPAALADARERGHDPRGATAVVTLEPCCHLNKRTPPCVPALLAAGIERVVAGCLDPNPDVNGKGLRQLQEAGVTVVTADGPIAEKARHLLAPFIVRTVHGRPFVTVKWAQDADGRIAGAGGERRQISGQQAHAAVHLLRSRCAAVIVGGETVRRDDPLLTVRGVERVRSPLRVVVTGGRGLDLPMNSRLFQTPHEGEVLVYTSRDLLSRIRVRMPDGVRLVAAGDEMVDLREVLGDLHRRGVWEVLVESGGRLAESLVSLGLADRIWVFSSPRRLGEDGPRATTIPFERGAHIRLGDDDLTEGWNPRSPVYCGTFPSADLLELSNPIPRD